MKLFGLVVLVMAVLALLGGASADPNPKGIGGAIRKGGKVIKHGLGVIGVIGTGHEIYQQNHN
ncbi:hypothetical protein SFRURICE_008661 [Spodoptera frugiperda]|uniref:SFRICE_033243 n=1 Tax=Spodoptera frugiperda TaxID=7108 RepID=A0A2H1WLP0_SPOFR|nr:hypothetical protein SFRURICE_008661 [Spodoptera frugiperda]